MPIVSAPSGFLWTHGMIAGATPTGNGSPATPAAACPPWSGRPRETADWLLLLCSASCDRERGVRVAEWSRSITDRLELPKMRSGSSPRLGRGLQCSRQIDA